MVDFTKGLWKNMTNSKVWRVWPQAGWDPLYGITSASGYLDNSPFLDMIRGVLKKSHIKKRVIVSAEDAISGSYAHFKLHEMDPKNIDEIVSAIGGSSAMPFIFPPMNMSKFGYD